MRCVTTLADVIRVGIIIFISGKARMHVRGKKSIDPAELERSPLLEIVGARYFPCRLKAAN